MSTTPGWKPKEFKAYTPGIPVGFNLTRDSNLYYLDNGQEFKDFPNTQAGWELLCEELKGMEPHD